MVVAVIVVIVKAVADMITIMKVAAIIMRTAVVVDIVIEKVNK